MAIIKIAISVTILVFSLPAFSSSSFKIGDILMCNPGTGMSYENSRLGQRLNTWRPDGTLFVHFKPASKAANVAPPKDGECAWEKRPFTDSDPEIIRMQARNTLKVMNAFFDNTIFKVKILSGSDSTASKSTPFLMMGWVGGGATIK